MKEDNFSTKSKIMHINIKTKLLLKTGLVLILVIVMSLMVSRNIDLSIKTTELVYHTHQVLQSASSIEKLTIDMETGQRGFLISGKPEFLEPYHSGKKELAFAIKTIKSLVSDNPPQVERITQIQNTIQRWDSLVATPEINLRRNFQKKSKDNSETGNSNSKETDTQDFLALIDKGTGKRIMDDIRIKLFEFKNIEQNLMVSRRHESTIQNQQTKGFVIFGTIFIILFSTGWGLWLSNKISKPIVLLKAASDEIIKGNYPEKVSIQSNDEIAALGNVFNRMVETIKSNENSILLQKQTAEAARQSAELANNAKTNFLSQMSHELRTPLNSIIGFSQLILNSKKNPVPEILREDIAQIENSGQLLLELINQILELSKIEAGKLEVSIEPVALSGLIKEVLDLMQPIAQQKEVTLLNKMGNEPGLAILGDHFRCKQVFLNLISNAIKYNSIGGEASVFCEKNDHQYATIFVEDTGIGINHESSDRIFEPFERLAMESSGIPGTGVGLAISKNLVELMDGEIGFKKDLAKGSSFFVKLPLYHGDVKDLVITKSKISPGELDKENKDEVLKVLYIEDNPINLAFMERFFSELKGVQLLSAHTAELGLDISRSRKLDLILMDINLPGMSGDEACWQIKNNELTKNIPVVAVSANAIEKDIKKSMKSGFSDYITKPVEFENLQNILKKYLNLEAH